MLPAARRRFNVIICCMALTGGFAAGFASRCSFIPPSVLKVPPSRTVLSMNLFDRFARVAKANLNNVLKSLEEPEKILNQAIEDMQVRSCYFHVRATTFS